MIYISYISTIVCICSIYCFILSNASIQIFPFHANTDETEFLLTIAITGLSQQNDTPALALSFNTNKSISLLELHIECYDVSTGFNVASLNVLFNGDGKFPTTDPIPFIWQNLLGVVPSALDCTAQIPFRTGQEFRPASSMAIQARYTDVKNDDFSPIPVSLVFSLTLTAPFIPPYYAAERFQLSLYSHGLLTESEFRLLLSDFPIDAQVIELSILGQGALAKHGPSLWVFCRLNSIPIVAHSYGYGMVYSINAVFSQGNNYSLSCERTILQSLPGPPRRKTLFALTTYPKAQSDPLTILLPTVTAPRSSILRLFAFLAPLRYIPSSKNHTPDILFLSLLVGHQIAPTRYDQFIVSFHGIYPDMITIDIQCDSAMTSGPIPLTFSSSESQATLTGWPCEYSNHATASIVVHLYDACDLNAQLSVSFVKAPYTHRSTHTMDIIQYSSLIDYDNDDDITFTPPESYTIVSPQSSSSSSPVPQLSSLSLQSSLLLPSQYKNSYLSLVDKKNIFLSRHNNTTTKRRLHTQSRTNGASDQPTIYTHDNNNTNRDDAIPTNHHKPFAITIPKLSVSFSFIRITIHSRMLAIKPIDIANTNNISSSNEDNTGIPCIVNGIQQTTALFSDIVLPNTRDSTGYQTSLTVKGILFASSQSYHVEFPSHYLAYVPPEERQSLQQNFLESNHITSLSNDEDYIIGYLSVVATTSVGSDITMGIPLYHPAHYTTKEAAKKGSHVVIIIIIISCLSLLVSICVVAYIIRSCIGVTYNKQQLLNNDNDNDIALSSSSSSLCGCCRLCHDNNTDSSSYSSLGDDPLDTLTLMKSTKQDDINTKSSTNNHGCSPPLVNGTHSINTGSTTCNE